MSSWAAEEETDSDEEVQQPVSPTPVVTETAPAPRPSRAPAKSTPMIGLMLGINYDAHIEDVEDFLSHNEIKFVHIEMLEGKDGHFSGRAKIEFSEDSSFERFIGLNGAEFMNKDIITKEWESRERAPRGGNGGRRGGDRDRDDRRPRPTSGAFNDARKQPHEYAPRSDRDFPPRGNRDYPPRERGERGDRDRHSNNRDRNNNQSNSTTAASAPAERPRLQLAPRTKPIEEIGKPEARADIFGGGRPHDELEFQRRKQVEKSTDAAEEVTGTEQPSTASENNNNSKKGRKENSKPASAGGEKRERKDKKDRKERSKDASEQDSTLAEDMSKLQVSETPVAAAGEVDGDFTVVERGGKKKTNTAGAPPASSSTAKKNNNSNSNNNKGAKNGPPRQEHANSRNSNRNKDSHSNNNNNKPASAAGAKKDAAGASSTSPSATAAPSPKVPSNAANKTAFAGLADDSDHDD